MSRAIVYLIKSHATQMAVAMPENLNGSGVKLGTRTELGVAGTTHPPRCRPPMYTLLLITSV